MKEFKNYPLFKPNLTPREMFLLGSFGGTYWRPIYSSITDKKYKDEHKKFPKSWWNNIPEDHLSSSTYNKKINKYKVKVGSSLEMWEEKNWITSTDPYGWVQWYCNFYNGRRSSDDKRQIRRWRNFAGEISGRWRKRLVTEILKKNKKWNDYTVSPKIRQILQHWGYVLTKEDFDKEVKHRK